MDKELKAKLDRIEAKLDTLVSRQFVIKGEDMRRMIAKAIPAVTVYHDPCQITDQTKLPPKAKERLKQWNKEQDEAMNATATATGNLMYEVRENPRRWPNDEETVTDET